MSSISFIGLGAWPAPWPLARSKAATLSSSSAATRQGRGRGRLARRRGHGGDVRHRPCWRDRRPRRAVHQRRAGRHPVRGCTGGKVIIDISNTFNADATGLVTPAALPARRRSPRPCRRARTS
ncbi:hypothetical protein NKG05_15105 [Oerskovia sp. M15]